MLSEVATFTSGLPIICYSPSIRWEVRKIRSREFRYGLPVRITCKLSKRTLLSEVITLGAMILYAAPVLSAPLQDMKDPDISRYYKLQSGVKIQDIVDGEGTQAHEGDLVEFNYVCRRSNGYFVHSTVDQFSGESNPVILPLDDREIIHGLKDVLVGVKVGGKRRALIPPEVGYVNENLKPVPDENLADAAKEYHILPSLRPCINFDLLFPIFISLVLGGVYYLMQRRH